MKLISNNIRTASTVESGVGRKCPCSSNGLLSFRLSRQMWCYPLILILEY